MTIDQLEAYFNSIELPEVIKTDFEVIQIKQAVEISLIRARSYKREGKPTFLARLEKSKLEYYKKLIENENI